MKKKFMVVVKKIEEYGFEIQAENKNEAEYSVNEIIRNTDILELEVIKNKKPKYVISTKRV